MNCPNKFCRFYGKEYFGFCRKVQKTLILTNILQCRAYKTFIEFQKKLENSKTVEEIINNIKE